MKPTQFQSLALTPDDLAVPGLTIGSNINGKDVKGRQRGMIVEEVAANKVFDSGNPTDANPSEATPWQVCVCGGGWWS